ncbi:MAG: hypothetical protein JHC85_10530, partial [Chthoniobacterales bacterium]|nr:hypothetical protein [Chthoniobacterales bacterium]
IFDGEFVEERGIHISKKRDGDELRLVLDGDDPTGQPALSGVDTVAFELLRGGKVSRWFFEPDVGDSPGAVKRDPGQIEQDILARLQGFEISEGIAFEDASAGKEVEGLWGMAC